MMSQSYRFVRPYSYVLGFYKRDSTAPVESVSSIHAMPSPSHFSANYFNLSSDSFAVRAILLWCSMEFRSDSEKDNCVSSYRHFSFYNLFKGGTQHALRGLLHCQCTWSTHSQACVFPPWSDFWMVLQVCVCGKLTSNGQNRWKSEGTRSGLSGGCSKTSKSNRWCRRGGEPHALMLYRNPDVVNDLMGWSSAKEDSTRLFSITISQACWILSGGHDRFLFAFEMVSPNLKQSLATHCFPFVLFLRRDPLESINLNLIWVGLKFQISVAVDRGRSNSWTAFDNQQWMYGPLAANYIPLSHLHWN